MVSRVWDGFIPRAVLELPQRAQADIPEVLFSLPWLLSSGI